MKFDKRVGHASTFYAADEEAPDADYEEDFDG